MIAITERPAIGRHDFALGQMVANGVEAEGLVDETGEVRKFGNLAMKGIGDGYLSRCLSLETASKLHSPL